MPTPDFMDLRNWALWLRLVFGGRCVAIRATLCTLYVTL